MITVKFFQKVSHLQGFLKIVVLDRDNKKKHKIKKISTIAKLFSQFLWQNFTKKCVSHQSMSSRHA